MKRISQRSFPRTALSAAAGLLLVLALSVVFLPTATVLGAEIPDVSGPWNWTSHTVYVVQGNELDLEFWGVDSEGPVLHVICDTWGTLNIVQNGASFTGSSDQSAQCTTKGGQPAATFSFPPTFDVEGLIQGHSIEMTSPSPVIGFCSWQGSIQVHKGIATQFHTVGGCDINILPFRPAMAQDINFDGARP